jgi:hypothetical protein
MELGGNNDERRLQAGKLPTPANDLKSLNERYEETLAACRFWKYMPKARIREQTFLERVQRQEMLKLVAKLEHLLGRSL